MKICGPLEVEAYTRDDKGDAWGRLLRWRDAEGVIHEWPMPMSLLAGDGGEYRARLLDGGLFIAPGRKARELLTTYILTAQPQRLVRCVSRIGWHGDVFVLPDQTIGPASAERILYQHPSESEHRYGVSGTVEDWRNYVGRFCSGNSRLILPVSCSFAGPLLTVVGAESGGIHLYGSSSAGKTTAQRVGGSVCGGGGKNGFLESWRATINGLEAVAAAHNDGTLFLDEISQVDPRESAETAYMLANGQGKQRMTRSIGTRSRLNWNLLFFSSGELTLADHARTAGKRTKGGAEVRLINIEADGGKGMGVFENIHDAKSPDAFARQLQNAARRHYGAPLREYLGCLTGDRADVETWLKKFIAAFVTKYVPAGASGEVFRAAQRFALIAGAGELATGWEISGWQQGEADRAAARCFREWLQQRETQGSFDAQAAIRQIRAFLGAHGDSRFQAIRRHLVCDRELPVRDRIGFRRVSSTSETEYLVLQEAFKTELCAGFDHRSVRKVLEERGYLIRQHPHWTIKPNSLPGFGKDTRVYCIRAAILDDDQ